MNTAMPLTLPQLGSSQLKERNSGFHDEGEDLEPEPTSPLTEMDNGPEMGGSD